MHTCHSMTSRMTEYPQISAYLFDTTANLNAFTESFVPPTTKEIFDTWGRYSGATAWYDGGVTPAGDAAAWAYNTTYSRCECTANTATRCGFINPDKLDSFSLESTLSSTSGDDDHIGVVAAFQRTATSTNKVLNFIRANNSNIVPVGSSWFLEFSDGATTVVLNDASSAITSGKSTAAGFQGWIASGPTRVKVSRSGNIISAVCSPFGSLVYDESTRIEVDLAADSRLASFIGPQSYGYMALSQTAATFTDIVLSGNLATDKVYDKQTGSMYTYNTTTSTWVKQSTTISKALGFPRKVLNPETGILYYINNSGAISKL